jgi:hypothetical protein
MWTWKRARRTNEKYHHPSCQDLQLMLYCISCHLPKYYTWQEGVGMVRSYTGCGVTLHDASLWQEGEGMVCSYTGCGVTLHDKSLYRPPVWERNIPSPCCQDSYISRSATRFIAMHIQYLNEPYSPPSCQDFYHVGWHHIQYTNKPYPPPLVKDLHHVGWHHDGKLTIILLG